MAHMISSVLRHVLSRRQSLRLQSSSCPFKVLGIAKTSSYEHVKKAFLKLALEHHPDTSKSSPSSSAETFTQIRQAFESIQHVNGQATIVGAIPEKWNDESLQSWFHQQTGQNLSFRMDAATRRQVADAAAMSPGGLDKGGMWELARTIASEEKSSPVMDDPLQLDGSGKARRRKKQT
jgi:DnaJ domain